MQKISAKGIALVKSFEALKLRAYPDVGGKLTIGYGHTGALVVGMVCSEADAERFLLADLQVAENAIRNHIDVPLTQEQFDALVSFVFNVGRGNFISSTMRAKLNLRDYRGAADEFPRWRKVRGKICQGLVNRRKKEQELFLSGQQLLGV